MSDTILLWFNNNAQSPIYPNKIVKPFSCSKNIRTYILRSKLQIEHFQSFDLADSLKMRWPSQCHWWTCCTKEKKKKKKITHVDNIRQSVVEKQAAEQRTHPIIVTFNYEFSKHGYEDNYSQPDKLSINFFKKPNLFSFT